MKYLYWSILALVVTLGLGFSVYMSKEPEIISKIDFSYFQDSREVAEALLKQVQPELQQSHLVMLGVMPGRKIDLEIWKQFLDKSSAAGLPFQAIVVEPALPGVLDFFPTAVRMDLKTELARFIEGAKNARARNLRMAVIVPSIYSSQSLQDNPADLLVKTSDLKPLGLSLVAFPRSPQEELQMEIPCVMGANDRQGTGALGCLALTKARLFYQTKSRPGFLEGIVDLVRERDYLILLNSQ